MDVISVSACVQTVIGAFQDAAGLVRQIKTKQGGREADDHSRLQISELESSLDLGPPIVQGQYDSDFRKFGETYARGDSTAREQLKDVLISLQMAVLSNLTGVWMGSKYLDAKALQAASDESRVNAVSCLIQWQQRLASAAAAQQQQRSISYQMSPGSRGMTPPLTTASSYSGRSDVGAGFPLTPDEQIERSNSWAALSYSAPPQQMPPGNYMHQAPSPGREEVQLPSPIMGNTTRPALSHQQSLISNMGSEPAPPVPYRYPHRPSISSLPYPVQSEPARDQYGQPVPSRTSTMTSEHDRLSTIEPTTSILNPLGVPRSPERTYIGYPPRVSPTAQNTTLSPPPTLSARASNRTAHSTTAHPDSNTFELAASEPTVPFNPNSYQRPDNAQRLDRQPSVRGPPQSAYSPLLTQGQTSPPLPPPKSQGSFIDRKPVSSPPPPIPAGPITHRPRAPSANPPPIYSSTPSPAAAMVQTSFPPPPLGPLVLPTEGNNYLGFCKGAFKLQCNLPIKKAFNIETRPSGLYSTFQVWRCSKCSFEGPLSVTNSLPGSGRKAGKPEKIFDQRLRASQSGGIQYRWAFLAKSHVKTTDTVNGVVDGSFGTFGCLFCCAEGPSRGWNAGPGSGPGPGSLGPMGTTTTITAGKPPNADGGVNAGGGGGGGHHHGGRGPGFGVRSLSKASVSTFASTLSGSNNQSVPGFANKTGTLTSTTSNSTPMFGNVESFMQHLEMHRIGVGQPGLEMQRRTKCIVGRAAAQTEDFEINLLPMDEGSFRP